MPYNADEELKKGAKLTCLSFDKKQTIKIISGKVIVGGEYGIVEISGIAEGRKNASTDGTINLWLSIFRYKRPDGTVNHVAGWNIMLSLKNGQTAEQTAKEFVDYIEANDTRPYTAHAEGGKVFIRYCENK